VGNSDGTYPGIDGAGIGGIPHNLPTYLNSNTTAFQQAAVVFGPGSYGNSVSSWLNGTAKAITDGWDGPVSVTQPLDLGFNRDFQSAGSGFQGDIGQWVMIGGDASANDIARAHTLDKTNWGTP
jgi:hypothetical protein